MARYGEAFRNRVVARLLPPESANVGVVAKEIGGDSGTGADGEDGGSTDEDGGGGGGVGVGGGGG